MADSIFSTRDSIEQVEEGIELVPRFDSNGLIPVVTTDHDTGELLMHGFMNEAALIKTIETGEAYYWSRSRHQVWHKGSTSGLIQKILEGILQAMINYVMIITIIVQILFMSMQIISFKVI